MSGDRRVVPLKLKQDPRVLDPQKISFKCTDEDSNKNKEELPIFADGSQAKLLLMLIDNIIVPQERYGRCANSRGKCKLKDVKKLLRKINRANNAVQKATNDQEIELHKHERAKLKATTRGRGGNTGGAGADAKDIMYN